MKRISFAIAALLSLGLFSAQTLARKQKINNCDYKCNYMCILSDALDCPEQCGCQPYPFKDHKPSKCEKYCHLFSEAQDCFHWCDRAEQRERFQAKGFGNEDAEQSIIHHIGHNQNDQELSALLKQIKAVINQQSTQTQSHENLSKQLSQQLSLIQTSDSQEPQQFDLQCVTTCTDQGNNSLEQLKKCILETCLTIPQSTLQLNQDIQNSTLQQQSDEQTFITFMVNTVIALLISGIFVFVIGFGGMKLFQRYQKKDEDLCDALLSHDYVRINDNYIKSIDSSNGDNSSIYNPPMRGKKSKQNNFMNSTFSPINTSTRYNSYSHDNSTSSSFYTTSDPTQIQIINKKIKEAKNSQYQSQNRSSNKLCLSGSYNKIDEDEDEHDYDNDYDRKYMQM